MTHLPHRRAGRIAVVGRVAVVGRKTVAQLRNRRRRRRSVPLWRRSGDEGFVLLETLVSISLIAVVMAAFTTFFVNSVAFTSQQRATQVATQIADSAVDTLRALPVSDLIKGRDATSVVAQFTAASPTVALSLSSMLQTVLQATADPTALPGSGATATVPTVAVLQTVNSVIFSRNVYLGTCAMLTGVTVNAGCLSPTIATGTGYLRAVVAVTWAGARCPASGCTYVTSTLLSTVDDPLFNSTPSPPAAPGLTYPDAKIPAGGTIPQVTWAVGDTVTLLPTILAVPSYSVAVTSGSLPAGVTLTSATGLISGTPTAVTASTSVTLTLTDGFGRVIAATFSWSVVPALTSTASAQSSLIGTAITPLLVSASGGVPGYTWSVDPGGPLPPGLTLSTVNNQARITGTPTTTGIVLPLPLAGVTFLVTLMVTDSTTTRKTVVSFPWTVNYPPFAAANPGPQTSTVGAADTVILTVTGGSGTFAWTGGGTLPAGLALTSAGVISGTPTTAGVTSVTLTATDTKITGSAQPVTIGWTVFAAPTVTSPGPVVRDVGESVSMQLATTCPNAPCSYVLNNGPTTLGINAGGLMTGTLTTAQTLSAVTVTVTDSSGGTATSATFAVTVNALPTVSSPGNQTTAPGAAVGLNVAALGGTLPLTYSQTGLPSWLTLNPLTGAITGTAPTTPSTTSGIILTVTDARGKVSVPSPAFSWTVAGAPSAPTAVIAANGDGAVTVSWTAPTGTVTGYTATVSPGGASCTTTGALSCVISGLTNGVHYALTVTATNGGGTSPASTAVIAIPYPAGVMSAANGLTLWLDGADPTVLWSSCAGAATTTSIGCWKDKSGQAPANNFSQATAANQPTVGTWNGLPAANFADSGDVLSSVNASAQYQTVFVAANVTNPAGSNVIVSLFGQAGQDYNARIGSLANRSGLNANDWAYNTGSPPKAWTNGVQGANAVQPLPVITTDQAVSVKSFTASVSNTVNGRGLTGQVGDVITFNKVLSTAERQTVEAYLSKKWGVAITSQTLTAPQAPTGVTASSFGYSNPVVSWIAPTNNGGAPITSYTVTSAPGGFTCTTSGLTCTAAGALPFPYAYYTFTVTATNSVGVGPPSAPSNSVLL